MACTMSGGVGLSGSPIPRLIPSTPAARLAAICRSSCANAYGGMRCRRSLSFMRVSPRSARAPLLPGSCGSLQFPDELLAQLSLEHRLRPSREAHAPPRVHLDLELSAIQHDRDARARAGAVQPPALAEHVRHRGAAGAGARGKGLPHPALEYARANARRGPGLELGVPGDVRAVGKVRMPFDRRSHRPEIPGRERGGVLHPDLGLWNADRYILEDSVDH